MSPAQPANLQELFGRHHSLDLFGKLLLVQFGGGEFCFCRKSLSREDLGCRQGRWCRLRLRLFPQDCRGKQRDDKPNREGLDESHQ